MGKNIELDIMGLGWIMYSQSAVEEIEEGEDYLESHYWEPEFVADQVNNGKIVGVCTDPGSYQFHIKLGYPSDDMIVNAKFKLPLGIVVTNGMVCIRDLYDLMDWEKDCPKEQQIPLENGNYEIIVLSNVPNSGYYGYDQRVFLYFHKVDELPQLRYKGVPQLLEASKYRDEQRILQNIEK